MTGFFAATVCIFCIECFGVFANFRSVGYLYFVNEYNLVKSDAHAHNVVFLLVSRGPRPTSVEIANETLRMLVLRKLFALL